MSPTPISDILLFSRLPPINLLWSQINFSHFGGVFPLTVPYKPLPPIGSRFSRSLDS